MRFDNDEAAPTPLNDLASGFRKRTWVTAKLAAKLGTKAMKRSFLQRGPGEAQVEDVDAAVNAAKDLVLQMGQLKGVVMKFGQMASYLPGALPAPAQEVLAQLQSESIAMSFERVAEVIEAELGASPDALFDDFVREPFAAASIGQVHRARLDGREVAVKVQYPGIEDLIAGDLSTLRKMASLATFGTPINGAALADELRERTLEECDYRLEAARQRLFGEILDTHERCDVPSVIEARSARRVLTTELVPRLRFAEFIKEAPQSAIDRAAARIYGAAFDCLFHHCVYNGDPHPGNYLFSPEGEVTFLDFGCVRHFDAGFIDRWKRFAITAQDEDYEGFKKTFPGLGLTPKPDKLDWEAQWDAIGHLYTPMRQREPFFTFHGDYLRENYGKMVFDNPDKMRLDMPPEWLLLNRLQWGLFAVFAHMNATAPWPDIFRAAIESETRPAPRVRVDEA